MEDCGEVLYDARIRVMPSCWFMLTRMFVRVDGACVRIKETRLFHAFDADCRASDGSIKIHVVVTWKELDLEPPLTSVVKESNTNTTAKTYTTSAPSSRPGTSNIVNMGPVVQNNNSGIQHLLRKPQELSEKLPVVNNKYAIPQFYTLALTR